MVFSVGIKLRYQPAVDGERGHQPAHNVEVVFCEPADPRALREDDWVFVPVEVLLK